MKKIAIVTLFDFRNIGNKLQNYALQSLIIELGYSVETLVCKDFIYQYSFFEKIKIIVGKFLPRYKKIRMDYFRKKIFLKSTIDIINTSGSYSWSKIRNNTTLNYDAYIVGSDQVWFNWHHKPGEMEFRFLEFVSPKKRICFSPSFGVDTIPGNEKMIYEKGLRGFERLSCREKSGCEIIKSLTGKNALLLCDPTMMILQSEWDSISHKPDFYDEAEPYILLYFLSEISSRKKTMILEYAKKYSMKILDIYNPQYPQFYNTTPQEFLFLIKHASFVFTNSFHGTVFSIIYHKNFTTFVRTSDEERMNNRCTTVLEKFDLKDRLNQVSDKKVDWEKVDCLIKIEREKGINFLKEELERAL